MKVANLAQIHFLLDIYHSVFERFNLSSNLVRSFVEACLFQIRFVSSFHWYGEYAGTYSNPNLFSSKIAKQTATSYLSKLERRLKLAVQVRLFPEREALSKWYKVLTKGVQTHLNRVPSRFAPIILFGRIYGFRINHYYKRSYWPTFWGIQIIVLLSNLLRRINSGKS
jgi:hypothetical protein